jgi:U3 small nucleolar RNA-associated protein 4
VFSSGVDQKITQYLYVKTTKTVSDTVSKTTSKWVQSFSKRMHSHDVRSLAMWPPYTPLPKPHQWTPSMDTAPILVSGGLDMSVTFTPCASPQGTLTKVVNPIATSTDATFSDSYHRRMSYTSGAAAQSGIRIAKKVRLIMSMGDTDVSIWRIPPKSSRNPDEAEEEQASEGWERVLQMSFNLQTTLVSGAISDDGRWLAISDLYETKMFSLTLEVNIPYARISIHISQHC